MTEKTRRQLRAEAVGRLKSCYYTSDSDLMRAILSWGHEPHTGDESRLRLISMLTDDGPPEGDITVGAKVRTPEPWEVCDMIERISHVCGKIDAVSDFCPPQVSRQLGNATNTLTNMISDLAKLLEGE